MGAAAHSRAAEFSIERQAAAIDAVWREVARAMSGAAPEPVALAHDYLLFLRGGERTFAAIAEVWPEAPIFTAAYRERATEGRFAGREIRTSWMQRLGVNRHWYRVLLPLYPRAIESLRLDGYEDGRILELRLRPRRPRRSRRRPRLLLPQPVPLRMARERKHAGAASAPRSAGRRPDARLGATVGPRSLRAGHRVRRELRDHPRAGSRTPTGVRPR